jgi:hypothetical protein
MLCLPLCKGLVLPRIFRSNLSLRKDYNEHYLSRYCPGSAAIVFLMIIDEYGLDAPAPAMSTNISTDLNQVDIRLREKSFISMEGSPLLSV